jgi:hypothetical protein
VPRSAIGDHLTFTAAVTTDPGAAAPTIAWSSVQHRDRDC